MTAASPCPPSVREPPQLAPCRGDFPHVQPLAVSGLEGPVSGFQGLDRPVVQLAGLAQWKDAPIRRGQSPSGSAANGPLVGAEGIEG